MVVASAMTVEMVLAMVGSGDAFPSLILAPDVTAT